MWKMLGIVVYVDNLDYTRPVRVQDSSHDSASHVTLKNHGKTLKCVAHTQTHGNADADVSVTVIALCTFLQASQ